MAKSMRAAAAADSNERILDAAAALFRQQGYAATTVRDIARAAGMLPGSLHYRYPSKEEVLAALMERAIDRLIAGVLTDVAGINDPVERVRLAIRSHLRLLLSGDDAVYVLLYDWRALSPATAQSLSRQRVRYERFADELIAQASHVAPLRGGVDLVLLRRFGFGAANWVAQWYEPHGPYSVDDIADHFWNYIAYGVFTGPWPPPAPAPAPGGTRGAPSNARKSRA
jgi:AcrR family transcriptional regulator